MAEILSKCGYRCDICPAYTGNVKGEEDRIRVSRGWKRLFGFDIPPDKVECTGCHNEGWHADAGCPVRPCAIGKGVENCAYCTEFECGTLGTRTGFLDDYLNDNGVSEEDYELYVKPYASRERLLKIRNKLYPAGETRSG